MTTDLPDAVLDYRADNFALGEELRCLLAVQQAGAVAAEVFYAARILEVLSVRAVEAVGLPASVNTYANLDLLHQVCLLPRVTAYWAHALRRTGNAARHVHRRLDGEDAELATLFLERWLCWFFVEYAHGPRCAVPAEALRVRPSADPELREVMRALEADAFVATGARMAALRRSPTLPAVASELLIERRETAAGRELALAGLERFGDDLRLRQLVGLSYSRENDLEQARRWLEPLLTHHRDDEETIGLAAGLFKRLADAAPRGRAWMERAHATYLRGWDRSRASNAYLGINAATTALLLGDLAAAGTLAAGVRDLLLDRLRLLGGTVGSASRTLTYWDSATLAEARLILGERDAARDAYREAFARHAKQRGNVEVTRRQMERLLSALGIEPGTFLPAETETS